MKRFAVIGDPVAHSLSPRIHRAFGEQTGIELDYQAIQVGSDVLGDALDRFYDEGYDGLNVTVPHKAGAYGHCPSHSEAATLAEASNTLIRCEQGWHADNTDGVGLLADLQALRAPLQGARVLVLGAGGAASGILPALLQAQPEEVVISSRNPWKPEALAQRLATLGPIRPCTHRALKGDRFDLLINATSVGHQGRFMNMRFPLLAEGAWTYDLSYGPAHQPFADWSRQQGAAQVHDGLGMLVGQAASAFALWTGQHVDSAKVLAALRSAT